MTILLVEDEPLLRRAFRALLEASGYQVREAGTAAEAVEQIAAMRPGLILLDLGLPDRDGLDVVRLLRGDAGNRGIPVVAMTGRGGADTERACAEAGCTELLVKPVSPRELIRRVPGWLDPGATDDRAGSPA